MIAHVVLHESRIGWRQEAFSLGSAAVQPLLKKLQQVVSAPRRRAVPDSSPGQRDGMQVDFAGLHHLFGSVSLDQRDDMLYQTAAAPAKRDGMQVG